MVVGDSYGVNVVKNQIRSRSYSISRESIITEKKNIYDGAASPPEGCGHGPPPAPPVSPWVALAVWVLVAVAGSDGCCWRLLAIPTAFTCLHGRLLACAVMLE